MNGACGRVRVVDHFLDEMEGAQAVSMEIEVYSGVGVANGVVNGNQFGSVVSEGGPLSPWVNGIAYASYGDVDSRFYFTGVGGVAFDEAAVSVGL